MSMMTRNAAFRAALEAALKTDPDLVEIIPSDAMAPRAGQKRVSLPPDVKNACLFAQGCAQAGLRPILDLTGVADAAGALPEALQAIPRAILYPMAVRLSARRVPDMPPARVVTPQTPREAAGALRFALAFDGVTVIAEDPLTAFDEGDVPEGDDTLFEGRGETVEATVESVIALDTDDIDPDPVPEPVTPAETGECGDISAVEDEPAAVQPPAGPGRLAFHTASFDSEALARTASEIDVPVDVLARLCARPAEARCEIVVSPDSLPGEAEFGAPGERDALMWIGRDRVVLSRYEERMTREEAASLLRAAVRRLSAPVMMLKDMLTL